MTLRFADTVQPEAIEWLWPGYLPQGKVVVLDGDPGLGKSTLLCDIAARLSTGRELPNGKQHAPMGVLLLMAEDGIADVTVPRLAVAGADLARIAFRENYVGETGLEEPPEFPADLVRLQDDITASDARLVVIDPIMSYLGEEINANSDQQVRRALMPLKDLAEETKATIVLVRHLNKMSGGNALYRGGGSIGFVGVARVALIMAKHPEDESRRILAVNKTNLGAMPPSLSFSVVDSGLGAGMVRWEGSSAHTAESILTREVDDDRRSAVDEALGFLQQLLADGPVLSTTVGDAAKGHGIGTDALNKAKRKLGVVSDKAREQHGKWVWMLPDATRLTEDTAPTDSPMFRRFSNFITLHKSIYKDTTRGGEDSEDSEEVEDTVSHPPVSNFSVTAPVVMKTGRQECAHCGRERVMTQGQPKLCLACRRTLAATGTEEWD